jgi:hypothetical protein
MVAVSLIAGIGLLLAGLLAIGFGIPVKEFSFGNTLILVGAIAACSGIIMLGLWTVVRELRNIARQLGPSIPADSRTDMLPPGAVTQAAEGGLVFGRDQPAPERADVAASVAASSPPPWHEEAGSRDRGRGEPAVSAPAEAPPALKPRRNLLFSSSSRKERERAQARTEPPTADLDSGPAPTPPASEPAEPPPASFDDAWPKSERARPTEAPLRRSGRSLSTFTEEGADTAAADRQPPPPAPSEDQPAVTVLKSGVVDGMAYSLYSDGSIEAQMPEGMMRFASIDELRAHLDQRS